MLLLVPPGSTHSACQVPGCSTVKRYCATGEAPIQPPSTHSGLWRTGQRQSHSAPYSGVSPAAALTNTSRVSGWSPGTVRKSSCVSAVSSTTWMGTPTRPPPSASALTRPSPGDPVNVTSSPPHHGGSAWPSGNAASVPDSEKRTAPVPTRTPSLPTVVTCSPCSEPASTAGAAGPSHPWSKSSSSVGATTTGTRSTSAPAASARISSALPGLPECTVTRYWCWQVDCAIAASLKPATAGSLDRTLSASVTAID